jgi:hypothetical protein
VPRYIPDNRALFIIGATWIGGAEGAVTGIIVQQIATSRATKSELCPGAAPCRGPIGEQLRAGFLGAIPGLALGLTTGALTSAQAPRYGRVALIQSAALGGAIMGALAQLGTQWHPYGAGWAYTSTRSVTADKKPPLYSELCVADPMAPAGNFRCPFPTTSALDLMPGALIGLNVGLVAGLLGAYLPDQSKYGPSWRRILLIDLAAAAGAVAGGVGGCVADVGGCLTASPPDDEARGRAALAAIGGSVIGLVGGILLTRHFDDDPNAIPPPADKPKVSMSTTLLPLRAPDGSYSPGIGAVGTF